MLNVRPSEIKYTLVGNRHYTATDRDSFQYYQTLLYINPYNLLQQIRQIHLPGHPRCLHVTSCDDVITPDIILPLLGSYDTTDYASSVDS